MTERSVESSPQLYARIGGVLYLLIIVLGGVGEIFVRGRLIVGGDAKATAANIRSAESVWRLHIAGELLLLICAIVLLVILFCLLRPVSRDLALLAVFFNLVSISIEATTTLHLVAVLFPLDDAAYLTTFTTEQLYAMATVSLRSHSNGFGLSLLFFGCFCFVIGYLIFKSGYLPRVVGVLMQIAGLSYLTNTLTLVLDPRLANRLFPLVLIPAFIG